MSWGFWSIFLLSLHSFFPLYFSSLDNSYRFSFKFTFFFLLPCLVCWSVSWNSLSLMSCFFFPMIPFDPARRSPLARAERPLPHHILAGSLTAVSKPNICFISELVSIDYFTSRRYFPPLLVCVSSFCWMKAIKRRIVDTEVKHIHAQKGHAPSPGSSLAWRVESTRPLARSRLDVAVVTLGAPQTRIPPPASRCGPVPCAGSAAWELSGSLFHP